MKKIEVRNIYKIFGARPQSILSELRAGKTKDEILQKTGHTVGINNASFSVDKGEIFVVMGLSGSGKSTLIRCLNRLIDPSAGEVLIDGENIMQANPAQLRDIRRNKISMVFQKFALFPHRTVCSNVEYGLEVQGVESAARRQAAYEALELVGLKGYEESYPDQLSGGMQQRVGLARALATDPDVLLMDEAFSALDPLIRKEMQEELLALQAKMQKTIVFITHDLDEALTLGDRIAVMKDGVIVQIGEPEDILTNPATDYVRDFVQGVDRTKIITAASIMQKPDALISPKDGTQVAVRRMRRAGLSSIFVTDSKRRLKGLVRIDDAVKLAKAGEHDLAPIIQSDCFHTTSPDASIAELLPMAANTQCPIVVVDDDQTMLGIIVRVSVISGIIGEEVAV